MWNGGTGGIPGSDIFANGIDVSANSVSTNNAGRTNAPFEAQYLKLYDVTAPPAPSPPGTGSANDYVPSNSVTFSWPAVSDSQGGISGYYVTVGTAPGGADVFSGFVTNTSLTVTNNFSARLYTSVRAVNYSGIQSSTSSSSPGIILIDPNWIPIVSMTNSQTLSWSSVSGKVYQVWSTTNLLIPFTPLGGVMTGGVPVITFTNHSTNAAQYFKIQVFP